MQKMQEILQMNNEKLSDWKAIVKIKDALEGYDRGGNTDYETLMGIKDILEYHGFIDEQLQKEDDISYYHCGNCKEDIAMELKCPCCGKR